MKVLRTLRPTPAITEPRVARIVNVAFLDEQSGGDERLRELRVPARFRAMLAHFIECERPTVFGEECREQRAHLDTPREQIVLDEKRVTVPIADERVRSSIARYTQQVSPV